MTEQECRALFFKEAYVLASSEPEMYRGFKIGLKVGAAAEREACAKACESNDWKVAAAIVRARREQ